MNSNDRKNRLRAFLLAAVMVATTVCGCAETEKKQGEMTDTETKVQQKEQDTMNTTMIVQILLLILKTILIMMDMIIYNQI